MKFVNDATCSKAYVDFGRKAFERDLVLQVMTYEPGSTFQRVWDMQSSSYERVILVWNKVVQWAADAVNTRLLWLVSLSNHEMVF